MDNIKPPTKEDYDKIPVKYCTGCLYIGNTKTVLVDGEKVDYCPYCGGTSFKEININEWEKKFEEFYKQGKYLNIKKSWKRIMEMSRN